MHVCCYMSAIDKWLYPEFTFCWTESFAGLPSEMCQNCPSLLCFGSFDGAWELLSGIVNVTNVVQILVSSYRQFVVQGHGALKQMSLQLSPQASICIFGRIVPGQRVQLVQDWSLISDLRLFPAQTWCNVVRFLLLGCLFEVADK